MIPLAGYPLPYLPVHVVWLELIIHPTALLVFQNLPAGEALSPRQPSPELRFFDRPQSLSIVLTGIVVAATIGLSLLLVQVPALAQYLHLRPLHADDWLVAAAGGLLAVLLPALGPLSRGARR